MSVSLWYKRFPKLISGVLVLGFIMGCLGPTSFTKQARAQYVVTDPQNTIQGTISAVADSAMAGLQSSLNFKELVLDGIAFAMINLVLHEMSRSIITWINSGFQGSPAFVTDFGGFLTGIADKVAGDYIWGSSLNFLCSPFKLDIRMALDIQYRRSRDYKAQCTLSGIANNVNNFANSANPAANWDRWFEVSQRQENNVYGALLLAQENMEIKISNEKGQQIKLLDFGKGLFSKKKCEKVEGIEKCSIVTPGTAIEAQLNNTLDSGQRRIQVADEFNEIVAALFTQLARQAFTGAAGLLGLTQSSSGGSYYDQLDRSTVAVGFTGSTTILEDAIANENEWLRLQRQMVVLLQGAKDHHADSCLADTPFPNNLQTKLTAALSAVATTELTLVKLTDMSLQLSASAGTPNQTDTQAAIMKLYMDMQNKRELHHIAEITSLRLIDVADTQQAVTTYKAGIDQACRTSEAP